MTNEEAKKKGFKFRIAILHATKQFDRLVIWTKVKTEKEAVEIAKSYPEKGYYYKVQAL